jgi:Tol biopolymer transport system component
MLAAADQPDAFVTVRQSMAPSEADASTVAVSRDGRYVAFVSYAPLTGRDAIRYAAVYVLDRLTGAVTLESASPGGCGRGRACGHPTISADGRFLVFETTIEGTASSQPRGVVLLRDRQTGATSAIAASRAPNGSLRQGAVSADGRTVVFAASATNLVPGVDANGADEDVFALDVVSGAIRRLDVDRHGRQPASGSSFAPAVSGDGRFVAFSSTAQLDDLPAQSVGGRPQVNVYLHDTQTGRTTRVSARPGGKSPNGSSHSATISDDGRYVAFVSDASDLVKHDRNRASDVFLYDVATGAIALVSRNPAGRSANGASTGPRLSADGAVVVFESDASDLTCANRCAKEARDINLLADVFAFDRAANAMRRISTGRASWEEASVAPAIDGTGSVVAFSSRHPCGPRDDGDDFDLFVGGMNKGTVLASKNRSP